MKTLLSWFPLLTILRQTENQFIFFFRQIHYFRNVKD